MVIESKEITLILLQFAVHSLVFISLVNFSEQQMFILSFATRLFEHMYT